MSVLPLLNNVWEKVKDIFDTVENTFDIVENRFFHEGLGLDTWTGKIWDYLHDLKDNLRDKVEDTESDLKNWMQNNIGDLVDVDLGNIGNNLSNVMSNLTILKDSFESGINSVLSEFNASILGLKADLENYMSTSLTQLNLEFNTMFQDLVTQLGQLGDIDLSNISGSFVEALTSWFDIDEEQLHEILDVRFPSG